MDAGQMITRILLAGMCVIAFGIYFRYAWTTEDPMPLRRMVAVAIGAPSGALLFLLLFGE